jgi:O-antigen/teichoic acid export membrane protein
MDRRLRRDVLWNLVPLALLGAVGLGLNFAIAAWWGAAALGVFNLVTIAYFALAVVGACGLQYAVLRAVAEAPEDREHVAAAVVGGLVPGVLLAALATAVFVLGRGTLADLHGSSAVAEGALWAAPGLFCFSVNKLLFGVVNGLRRMRAFAVYTSLRYVAIASALVALRAIDAPADRLPVIWTISEGLTLLVLAGELVATVSLARCAGWRRWARDHLAYAVRGVAATLAYEVNTKLDVWMLGALGVAKASIGIYSLAAALNEGAMQLAVVVQNNVNPMIARELAAGRPTNVEALVRRTRRWFVPVFAGACVVGAALYTRVIPAAVDKPEFVAGAWPFALLMAGAALASPYLPFLNVLLMANRPGWHTAVMVATANANLVCDLAFIPRFGMCGAALATATATVLSVLLLRVVVRARTPLRL